MVHTKNRKIKIHIASKLRDFRKQKKRTQEDLARHIGVTRYEYQKYEYGVDAIPTCRLYTLANILEQPIAHFFPPLPDKQSGAV